MKSLTIFLVRFVSAFFRWNQGRACRFYPTCSSYAVQAFETFGFFQASWLAAGRFLRCQPFSAGGFDPPPLGKS